MLKTHWTRWFSEIGVEDVPVVGGKNASLGEMTRELSSLGIRIPAGYAVTAEAYRHFLEFNGSSSSATTAQMTPGGRGTWRPV